MKPFIICAVIYLASFSAQAHLNDLELKYQRLIDEIMSRREGIERPRLVRAEEAKKYFNKKEPLNQDALFQKRYFDIKEGEIHSVISVHTVKEEEKILCEDELEQAFKILKVDKEGVVYKKTQSELNWDCTISTTTRTHTKSLSDDELSFFEKPVPYGEGRLIRLFYDSSTNTKRILMKKEKQYAGIAVKPSNFIFSDYFHMNGEGTRKKKGVVISDYPIRYEMREAVEQQ